MITIMVLTYTAIAIVVFKIIRIPVTKWTVTTTAFVGAFLILWICVTMAFFHPFTPFGTIYFQTTPISAQVMGKVIKVFVKDNRHLKKGDPLFQIDPTPFKAQVDQLNAELVLAKERLKETKTLIKNGAGRKYDLQRYQKDLDSLNAQLEKADFNLESTTVRAPADGHVTQCRVREGVTVGSFRFASVMTFVIDENPYYIAAFKPNTIQNIKTNAEAEVVFTSVPGKTFKGKVTKLWKEIAEGQLTPLGTKMIDFSNILPPGRIPVRIELTEDISQYYIPGGGAFGACVYSNHMKYLKILREVLLHMYSWKNIISFDEKERGE